MTVPTPIAQRGTSGATTGPRGARSAPPNPDKLFARDLKDLPNLEAVRIRNVVSVDDLPDADVVPGGDVFELVAGLDDVGAAFLWGSGRLSYGHGRRRGAGRGRRWSQGRRRSGLRGCRPFAHDD